MRAELINNIMYFVRKYNSKIDAANKLGLSYNTVLFYTNDIRSDILTAMNGGASYEARLVVEGIESSVVCSSR